MHACVYMHVCIYNKLCLRMSISCVFVCLYLCMCGMRAGRPIYICIYIYIYGPPPPMYPRLSSQSRLWEGMGSWDALVSMLFSEKAAGRRALMGSGACLWIGSSLSFNTKLSPRTKIGRIQTYSKRILLNTPRIQDSRFKVPGRTLPCTLNLESWIRGVFKRIRFEYA